jgi:anti-sigma factor RsiW
MPNEVCRQAEALLSRNAAEPLSQAEQQTLSLHLMKCPSCTAWAALHRDLRGALKEVPAVLAPQKMAAMQASFLAAPTPSPVFLLQPKVFGVVALAASLAAVLWFAPLLTDNPPTTAINTALGPHQGVIQERGNIRVELLVTPAGDVQVYLSDTKGTPQLATKPISMIVTAPSIAPTTSTLQPSPDQLFLVGKLPPVSGEAEVALQFPSGDKFTFPKIQGPATTQVASAETKPKGGTAKIGDAQLEAEILPKGEVRVKAYKSDGSLLPSDSFSVPEITVEHQGKPYPVKLAKKPSATYWTGNLAGNVQIDAGAEVKIVSAAPIIIQEITYQPAMIVFTPYVVVVSIKVVPVIIIKKSHKHSHKHGKGHKHSGSHR